MKQSILMLALTGMVLASCNKEQKATPESTNAPAMVTRQGQTNTQSYFVYLAYLGPESEGPICWFGGKNCAIYVGPEIVIKPKIMSALSAAVTSADVSAIFNNHELEGAYQGLDADMLSKLQSGRYGVIKRQEDDKSIIFAFSDKTPITDANVEFALKYSK
jgi:hypothetical protein